MVVYNPLFFTLAFQKYWNLVNDYSGLKMYLKELSLKNELTKYIITSNQKNSKKDPH